MRIEFIIYLSAFLSAGCSIQNETKQVQEQQPNNLPVNSKLQAGCYRMIIGRDTALLKVQVTGDIVDGDLHYNRFEKDDNMGTVKGVVIKNKIKLWYHFQSEGSLSLKEVYFEIVDDNSLAEGYGDMAAKNDSVYFKYPATLNYERQQLYKKIDCK